MKKKCYWPFCFLHGNINWQNPQFFLPKLVGKSIKIIVKPETYLFNFVFKCLELCEIQLLLISFFHLVVQKLILKTLYYLYTNLIIWILLQPHALTPVIFNLVWPIRLLNYVYNLKFGSIYISMYNSMGNYGDSMTLWKNTW